MKFTVRDMVEAALLVALAVVLGFIKIPLPGALGHVSLSFIPLILIALRNGPIKTFIYTGGVYGIIDCLLDGWGISTYPLEYLLAVGFLFIVSLFRKQLFNGKKNVTKEFVIIVLTIVVWSGLRLLLCSLDGFIQGWAPTFGESFIINAPNVLIDSGFTLVVLLLIYLPLRPLNVEKYLESK